MGGSAAAQSLTLEQRLAQLEEKIARDEQQQKEASAGTTNTFRFSGYARSGLLVNDKGRGGRAGPAISPASSIGGDAHIGRLGNEKITTSSWAFITKPGSVMVRGPISKRCWQMAHPVRTRGCRITTII